MRYRYFILLLVAGLVFNLYACKKSDGTGSGPAKGSLTGKWNVVSDSTFSGIGFGNHPVNYTGNAGDYFNFNVNGSLYTKEGAILDTLTYRLAGDTGLIISAFGVTINGNSEVSRIKTLTKSELTINAPVVATPGGLFGRTVHLTR